MDHVGTERIEHRAVSVNHAGTLKRFRGTFGQARRQVADARNLDARQRAEAGQVLTRDLSGPDQCGFHDDDRPPSRPDAACSALTAAGSMIRAGIPTAVCPRGNVAEHDAHGADLRPPSDPDASEDLCEAPSSTSSSSTGVGPPSWRLPDRDPLAERAAGSQNRIGMDEDVAEMPDPQAGPDLDRFGEADPRERLDHAMSQPVGAVAQSPPEAGTATIVPPAEAVDRDRPDRLLLQPGGAGGSGRGRHTRRGPAAKSIGRERWLSLGSAPAARDHEERSPVGPATLYSISEARRPAARSRR